jgi:hypothetical protein
MNTSTDALAAALGARPVDPLAGVPLLACRVCFGPLDAFHADVGTHPTCDPDPTPTVPPPSTLLDLRPILVEYEATRPRNMQQAIGPSGIAVACERRLGYALHGAPRRRDGRVPWAPLVGTAVHKLLAEALVLDNERLGRPRWLVEQRVEPDPQVSGECDAYDVDRDLVIDWKVVGPNKLKAMRCTGDPGPQYRGQIQIYGRGWQRAGRSPRWVRIVFLAKTTELEDSYEWTAPYSRAEADAALDRMYRINTLLRDLNVDDAPALWAAVPARPGHDCTWCPYFRRGAPADATGCPGDVAADTARLGKFTDGLIAPSTVEAP